MLKLELRKKYKSGSAAEIIGDAILTGNISGEIAQNEFADSLQVSRIPVREALIALEYHGLIEKMSNQHVRIINLSDADIRSLFADMSLLELEAMKSLPDERLEYLSSAVYPADFHRELYMNTESPLRKVFLRVITETYIVFVLEHSDGSRIAPVFETLKQSLRDYKTLRKSYNVYAEVLSDELIRIRREHRHEDMY
ncbi:MAG: GntR family transcriptional regulator [Synergistaceae bacterium]|nr:GntR family transcriptional regulator [Synergistaceae bacterium]